MSIHISTYLCIDIYGVYIYIICDYICVYKWYITSMIYIYFAFAHPNFYIIQLPFQLFWAKTPHPLAKGACHSKFPWPCGRNEGSVVHPSDQDLVHRDYWSESQRPKKPQKLEILGGGERWFGDGIVKGRWWNCEGKVMELCWMEGWCGVGWFVKIACGLPEVSKVIFSPANPSLDV